MAAGWGNPKDNSNATSVRPSETNSGAGVRKWFSSAGRTRVWDQDLNRLWAALRHVADTFGITDSEGDDSMLSQVLAKFLPLTGGTVTGTMTVRNPGGSGIVTVQGETGATVVSRVFTATAAQGGNLQASRARGTIASPAGIQQGDVVGNVNFVGSYDGTNFVNSVALRAAVTAATPGAGDMQGRLITLACASGSATATELHRMEHATGLSYGGANVYLNENRHPVLRSYTIATLPATGGTNTRSLIYVSDGADGKHLAISQGTKWLYPDGTEVDP